MSLSMPMCVCVYACVCLCMFCKDYALIMGRKFSRRRPWAASKSLQNWLLSAHKMCEAGPASECYNC